MKNRILILVYCLIVAVSGSLFSQGWETGVDLPGLVAGTSITSTATSAASTGYGVHLVGVYSGTVKHFYVSNNNQIVFNTLSVPGGEYPIVTNYNGKVRVTMKVNTAIKIYQSTDGGASWAAQPPSYTPGVSIYNLDAYTDDYGTHIVWDSRPPSDPDYSYEVYYARYDDRYSSFIGFKNVTDLTSPSQGAWPKVTTTPHQAHIVFPSNSGLNLTSRDLNLDTETWDASYIVADGLQLPIRSLSVTSYGDKIMTIGASDIITGPPGCTQTTLYTTRQQDDSYWVEEEPLQCTNLGTDVTRQMVVANLGKISVINYHAAEGITSQSYDIATETWEDVEEVEDFTGDQTQNSVFVAGGQFGTYYFWSGTHDSYHQHMRHKAAVPTTIIAPEMKLNWNMASVPVAVTNFTKTSVWPAAISSAWGYDNGNYVVNFLNNGTGYWVKYPSQQVVNYPVPAWTIFPFLSRQGGT